jgi:hypothetical protein
MTEALLEERQYVPEIELPPRPIFVFFRLAECDKSAVIHHLRFPARPLKGLDDTPLLREDGLPEMTAPWRYQGTSGWETKGEFLTVEVDDEMTALQVHEGISQYLHEVWRERQRSEARIRPV